MLLVFLWLGYVLIERPGGGPARVRPAGERLPEHPSVPRPLPLSHGGAAALGTAARPVGQSGGDHAHPGQPTKPVGVRITALVFYGRRDRVSILECYLRRNLVSNGGWLDEVIWAVNTDKAEDIRYLDSVLRTSELYRSAHLSHNGYQAVWETVCTQPDTLYIKIDDDVVFIDDAAIPRLVQAKLRRPDTLSVSANVINNPALGWLHYHMGAVHPYLPELDHPKPDTLSTLDNKKWRASRLPSWDGPADWKSPDVDKFNDIFIDLANATATEDGHIPRHRWLPLPHRRDISRTPVSQSEYDPFGKNLRSWAVCAQEHYSFLENLESGRLDRYYMIHGSNDAADSSWDMTGTRYSINFMAIWGRDVLANIEAIGADDEQQIAVDLPNKLNKREYPCKHQETDRKQITQRTFGG